MLVDAHGERALTCLGLARGAARRKRLGTADALARWRGEGRDDSTPPGPQRTQLHIFCHNGCERPCLMAAPPLSLPARSRRAASQAPRAHQTPIRPQPASMTAKHATINTVTLTCSNCGSGHFTKLDQNEYRCTHCQAVTLVEDNVAERLEQILRGMQAPATPRVKPNLAITAAAIAVAVISIPVVISLMNGLAHLVSGDATHPAHRRLAGEADGHAGNQQRQPQAAAADDAQRDRQAHQRAQRQRAVLPGRPGTELGQRLAAVAPCCPASTARC